MILRATTLLLVAVTARAAPPALETEQHGWAEQVVSEVGIAKPDTVLLNETNSEADHDILQNLQNDMIFYLYTKDTLGSPVATKLLDDQLFEGKLNVKLPVKLLIHGYFSGKDQKFSKKTREAYLNADSPYNVINVDWSPEAYTMYNTARNYVPSVGKVVALFIDKLTNQTGLLFDDLHVIGHSLGAHIAGVAGLHVQSSSLVRITGLDPAGPLFSYDDHERLQPASAEFVDVIHTCGKGLGFFKPLGHVEFYPNSGLYNQPGCSISFGKCSHERAVEYFVESLTNPKGFVGKQCSDWDTYLTGACDKNSIAYMGDQVSSEARGSYFLATAASSPFAYGDKRPPPAPKEDDGYYSKIKHFFDDWWN